MAKIKQQQIPTAIEPAFEQAGIKIKNYTITNYSKYKKYCAEYESYVLHSTYVPLNGCQKNLK